MVSAEEVPTTEPAQSITYCDLIERAAAFDLKRVRVRAVYSYGFEWQELSCGECQEKGKTYLDLGLEVSDRVKKGLKGIPKDQGVVIANFSGFFHGSGKEHYGHFGLPYSLEVDEVANLKILAKDMSTPLSKINKCAEPPRRKAELATPNATPTVVSAVAPVYEPIAIQALLMGDVSVEVITGTDGEVKTAAVLNGSELFAYSVLQAAKRWRFQAGGEEARAILTFSFKILPRDTPVEDLSAISRPPYGVEVKAILPEQTTNYGSAAPSVPRRKR